MAFSRDGLSRIGGSGDANAVWVYSSTEAPATVAGSGYFNNATNELKQFDIINAVTSTGGTPAVDVLVVTSATGASTVTVTNGT